MRLTQPSGGSHKLTIPITIFRETWGKSDEETKKERFLLCFIQENGRIVLEPPENIMKFTEYPLELKNKVNDEWAIFRKELLAKEGNELFDKLAKGEIPEVNFDKQFDHYKENFMKMASANKSAFSERELHFIASDDFAQLLATIFLGEEERKEEDFNALMEDVKKIKDELSAIREILKMLEEGFGEGRVSTKHYEFLKERYLGKLSLAERRFETMKKVLADP